MTSVAVILEDIRRRGTRGTTTEEASYRINVQSSSYTGRRSELHRRGALERLAEKRDGQHVYVLPEFVDGRDVRPYTPHRGPAPAEVEGAVHVIEDWLDLDEPGPARDALRILIDYVRADL